MTAYAVIPSAARDLSSGYMKDASVCGSGRQSLEAVAWISFDDTSLALMKFGVGQPVPRKEDPTLLRGQGRYTDDINLPGQA